MTPPRSRAFGPLTRRGLLAAGAGGLVAAGCGPARRTRYVQTDPPPAPAAPPAPPASLAPDPRRLLSAASFAAGVGSINDQEPLAPTGRWLPTASGIMVWVPQAVELVPGRAAELLVQVDAATSDPDTRLAADARLPAGSRVIALPGAFEVAGWGFPAWAVGLAGGPAWPNPPGDPLGPFSLVCWVSWRPTPSEPRLLPALRHEIRHLLTGDPMAGHVGGCCNAWMVSP